MSVIRFQYLLALLLLPPVLAAADPSFPEKVTVGETQLERVGTGTFKWMFFKVYDGAYYQSTRRPEKDPLSDVAKRLVLLYNRSLTAEQFRKSGNEFVRRNVSEEAYNQIEDRLRRLNEAYQDVEKGDIYALTYLPGKGTTLSLNGDPLVTVEGADFANAYFSIWLGEHPVKTSFRRQLLSSASS